MSSCQRMSGQSGTRSANKIINQKRSISDHESAETSRRGDSDEGHINKKRRKFMSDRTFDRRSLKRKINEQENHQVVSTNEGNSSRSNLKAKKNATVAVSGISSSEDNDGLFLATVSKPVQNETSSSVDICETSSSSSSSDDEGTLDLCSDLSGQRRTCVICLEVFGEVDEKFYTDCGHLFHFLCMKKWLNVQPTCPTCRAKVVYYSDD